jgi:hypothetical protein
MLADGTADVKREAARTVSRDGRRMAASGGASAALRAPGRPHPVRPRVRGHRLHGARPPPSPRARRTRASRTRRHPPPLLADRLRTHPTTAHSGRGDGAPPDASARARAREERGGGHAIAAVPTSTHGDPESSASTDVDRGPRPPLASPEPHPLHAPLRLPVRSARPSPRPPSSPTRRWRDVGGPLSVLPVADSARPRGDLERHESAPGFPAMAPGDRHENLAQSPFPTQYVPVRPMRHPPARCRSPPAGALPCRISPRTASPSSTAPR